MSMFSDLTDDEFVPFLKSLGVETYGKSFEWMLTDPDFAGVLKWMYSNFDNNNALSPREDYRYAEIVNANGLLSLEELEVSLAELKDQCPGLALPGDHDTIDIMKEEIGFNKERINMLHHHEDTVMTMIKQNELSKDELVRDIVRLNAIEKQCKEDCKTTSDKCSTMAEEVEDIMDNVVDIISEIMHLYCNAQLDMELSKKFFTFGPFEGYRQSQRLFKSHFDLYTSRKFNKKQTHTSDLDTRQHLVQAKEMEQRLFTAINNYTESLAELTGVRAMVQLLANYEEVHLSQIPVRMMECTSAVEMCEQEESILKRQIQDSARSFVEDRSKATAGCVTQAAVIHREQIYKDLCWLVELTETALNLDRVVYNVIRRELRNCADVMQFASDLRTCVLDQREAVASRMDSMNDIIIQQQIVQEKIGNFDTLIEFISKIYNTNPQDGVAAILKKHNDIKNNIIEIKGSIQQEIRSKQNALVKFKESTKVHRKFIEDSCTRLPTCWDRTVASLTHALRDQMAVLDKNIVDASGMYTSVKNGDKNNLRKLWQWFLTDPSKLMEVLKEVQVISYS